MLCSINIGGEVDEHDTTHENAKKPEIASTLVILFALFD